MANKESGLMKERKKALGEVLVMECRADEPNLISLNEIVKNGASVTYAHAKALYFAAKNLKFEAVAFLIRCGVLVEPIAASYVAKMCDAKGFDEANEPPFFEVLDLARDRIENYMELFVPYINAMAVTGRTDKLQALAKRYYLTESEIARSVDLRIIFETILLAHDETLALINRHVQWINQSSFDLVVSGGDWLVLEYMLGHGADFCPGDAAIATAVYSGFFAVLDILRSRGYTFDGNPMFLQKACRAAFMDGGAALKYLLKNGYAPTDGYGGKSIRENALYDGNETVLRLLEEHYNS